MEDNQLSRGRGKLGKTTIGIIMKDLKINKLDPNIVYDRIL